MNIAIVIASGMGQRTGNYIPKQFISVLDKPIRIYTLEKFQSVPDIQAIEVVCLKGWEAALKSYALQYGISKLKWITSGGDSAQESIYAGLRNIEGECQDNDIVVIHDGIRPMLDRDILDSCINVCKEKGNGVTALPVFEQIFKIQDAKSTREYIPREELRIVQTPQAYRYAEIRQAYEEAFKNNLGKHASSYANTMMAELGRTLYFSKGSTKNIKITTKDDIEIFRAMLMAEEE